MNVLNHIMHGIINSVHNRKRRGCTHFFIRPPRFASLHFPQCRAAQPLLVTAVALRLRVPAVNCSSILAQAPATNIEKKRRQKHIYTNLIGRGVEYVIVGFGSLCRQPAMREGKYGRLDSALRLCPGARSVTLSEISRTISPRGVKV